MNADHAHRVSQPGVGDFDEQWNLAKPDCSSGEVAVVVAEYRFLWTLDLYEFQVADYQVVLVELFLSFYALVIIPEEGGIYPEEVETHHGNASAATRV